MDAQVNLAFVFASDLTKQLITLASVILTLTITFQKELVRSEKGLWAVKAAWATYLLSIAAGVWGLMALVGTLAPIAPLADPSPKPITEITFNARCPAAFQIILFIIATFFVLFYGITSLATGQAQSTSTSVSETSKNS